MGENGDPRARGRFGRLIQRLDNDPRLLKLVAQSANHPVQDMPRRGLE